MFKIKISLGQFKLQSRTSIKSIVLRGKIHHSMIHTWFWLPSFWLSGRVTWYTLWQGKLYPPVSAMAPTLTPCGNFFSHSDFRFGPAASLSSLLGVLLRSKLGGTPLTYTSTCKQFVHCLFYCAEHNILYCVVNIKNVIYTVSLSVYSLLYYRHIYC